MGIRGQHNLLSGQVNAVERMQKLLLHGGFVREKMNVINSQNIQIAESVSEGVKSACFQSQHILIGKILRGGIKPFGVWSVFCDFVADALKEVGFADSIPAVIKQGIEGAFFLLGDGFGGVVGQFVFGPYDKRVQTHLQRFGGFAGRGAAGFAAAGGDSLGWVRICFGAGRT